MRRSILAAVHTGYWGMHILVLAVFLGMLRGPRADGRPLFWLLVASWPIVLIAIAPSAAAFYASYGPLFSRSLARRRIAAMFAGGAGISLAASGLGVLLALVLFGARQPVFQRFGELAGLMMTLAAIAAVQVAIALLVRGFAGWWQASEAPARELVPVISSPAPTPTRDIIFVKTEQRLEKIRLDEIVMIEGQRDYRRIHTTTRRIMTLQTFAEFERQLPASLVCRVHKSYMVAIGQIDSIERGRIFIQNRSVPISDTYRDRFLALIGQR